MVVSEGGTYLAMGIGVWTAGWRARLCGDSDGAISCTLAGEEEDVEGKARRRDRISPAGVLARELPGRRGHAGQTWPWCEGFVQISCLI